MANKKYRCTGCKDYFENPPGLITPGGKFHDLDCAYDRALILKESKKMNLRHARQSADRRTAIDLKKSNLDWQKTTTQKVFNKMRRLQELKWFADRGLPPRCISCHGLLGNDIWCNGHFKTTHNSALRYDESNCFLQHNRRCNKALSGDIAGTHNTMGYRKGIILRFGKVDGQSILDYCDNTNHVVNWTCEQLEADRKRYSKIIRELEAIN